MISSNPRLGVTKYKAVGNPHIDMKKLMRRRKWDGRKLGELIAAVAVNEMFYKYDSQEVMGFIAKKLPALDDEQKYIYSEYVLIYQLLHIMYKDELLSTYGFECGMAELNRAADMVELYQIMSKGNMTPEEKAQRERFCDKPQYMCGRLERAYTRVVLGVKRQRAINEIYQGLAAAYFPGIADMVKDLMPYKNDVLLYTRRRNQIIRDADVYYNRLEAGKTLLPEIKIKDFRIPEAVAVMIKKHIKDKAFTPGAKTQLLAYSNYIVDMLR